MKTPGSTSGFLEPPDGAAVAAALHRMLHEQLAGKRVGSFTLERVLDTGGMGAVFEALQQAPRRKVAVKVLRADVLSTRSVRRFRLEEELLAKLRHPGIAEIYDAGVLGPDCGSWSGLPWFAMEFIDGATSLLAYAERRNLSDQERVRLLTETCAAVGHAHAHDVVHRDLKPGNVLVDSDGRAKVIDFGVARATELDDCGTAPGTASGEIVGTMRYMSPEQAGARGAAVGPWTDVYALGVLGFELLTGRHPCEPRGDSLPELARSLETAQPLELRRVAPHLHRDLGTVLAKAIERDPRARYRDADELAQDLQRTLDRRPVRARRRGLAARLVRRVRARHAVPSVALALLALLAVAAWRLADRREAGSGAASHSALADTSPWSRRQTELFHEAAALVAEIVRESAERELPDTRHVAGVVEGLVVDYERALALGAPRDANSPPAPDLANGVRLARGTLAGLRGDAARALELAQGPPVAGELADEFLWLEATSLTKLGRLEESLAVFEQLVERRPEKSSTWFNQATVLAQLGRHREAADSYSRGLEINPDAARALDGLGGCLVVLGEYDQALTALRRSVELDPRSYNAHQSLAAALSRSRRFEEAVETMQFGLRLEPRNSIGHYNLGIYLQTLGRYEEAVESFQRALSIRPGTLVYERELAGALIAGGEPEEAAALLADLAEQAPDDARIHRNLGYALLELGRIEEARAPLERAVELDPGRAVARERLAILCGRSGDWERALHHFRGLSEDRPDDASARYNLACALAQLGRLEESFEALSAAASEPDLRALAATDSDLEALRTSPAWAERVRVLLSDP